MSSGKISSYLLWIILAMAAAVILTRFYESERGGVISLRKEVMQKIEDDFFKDVKLP